MATNREKIVPVHIEEEMRGSYLDYAMSVIISRALPDVRDGLKPVHRRVLTAMNDLNLTRGRPYRKSAKVTGDVTIIPTEPPLSTTPWYAWRKVSRCATR